MKKMVKKVGVHEAKTHLSALLKQVELGKQVIIMRSDTEIAKILPIEPIFKSRTPGEDVGKGWVADDFNAPMPPEFMRFFE